MEPGITTRLFVRDMVEKETVEIGGPGAEFETMSSDGSRVFFRENGELYETNMNTATQTDLTASHGQGEASAGVQDAILGASEEGCDEGAPGECNLYFVAKGVLSGANAEGSAPIGGEDNLYVLRDGTSGWSATYIATLASEDEHDWYATRDFIFEEGDPCNCRGVERSLVSSRVSGNGRYVTFMSNRSLTGYDNADAVSGQRDEEVFLYDAVARRLVCASCNPTGARPVGVLDSDGRHRPLADPEDAWGAAEGQGQTAGEHWLAGIIPSWWSVYEGATRTTSFYQPRALSDSGRLFFESPDQLVPQATNGLMDVYEYEPAGVGSCTNSSVTFGERSLGCVSLISGGTSSAESEFYDASENGNDVFFITTSELAPADDETAYALYDAHVCSAEVPCASEPVSPPACSSGDSCKPAPAPQPQIFGPAPSATFNGAGNIAPPPVSVKATAKSSRCKTGFVKKNARCVKAKAKSRRGRAKRAGNKRRAGR